MRELSNSKSNAVRKAVASNPNTPTDILFDLGAKFPEQLLSNPLFDLLLLENPNLLSDLPRNTLKKLLALPEVPKYFQKWVSQRSDLELIRIILNNPNTSKEILERLLEHENSEIKQMAKLHVNYMGEIKEGWDKIAFEEIKKVDRFIINSPRSHNTFFYLKFMPYLSEFFSKSVKDYLVAVSNLDKDDNLNYNYKNLNFTL